jgi:hypothetical protein
MEHSIMGAIGSAFEPSPWRATQQPAFQALGRAIA